ncbi:hypothetical protein [Streptomyces sp. NPDC007960]|uniref:hypothetical protein n=2 Tax=unclassified Streptomyces TaxID=2593676 RepID=UPI0036E99003
MVEVRLGIGERRVRGEPDRQPGLAMKGWLPIGDQIRQVLGDDGVFLLLVETDVRDDSAPVDLPQVSEDAVAGQFGH